MPVSDGVQALGKASENETARFPGHKQEKLPHHTPLNQRFKSTRRPKRDPKQAFAVHYRIRRVTGKLLSLSERAHPSGILVVSIHSLARPATASLAICTSRCSDPDAAEHHLSPDSKSTERLGGPS